MTVSEAAHAAQKEESLNLTSAVWFAWGVLLNAGIGEGLLFPCYNIVTVLCCICYIY